MQKNTKDSSRKKTVNTNNKMSKKQSIQPSKKTVPSTKKINKTSTTKKPSSKPVKKSTTKKTSISKSKKTAKKSEVIEYYDLPFRYNQTVVRILAQTPNTLFVYWDISDEDKKSYINKFGEDFFESTVPVLIVNNKTMNYTFEIEINDFANSWYFNINDPNCNYEIELGRKPKPNRIDLPNNYIHVTSSNVIESPNNHILFEKNKKVLFFRNVKTNSTFTKDVSKLEFMNYAGRIYNIYEMYKEIYKHEELDNLSKMSSSNF